MKDLRLCTFIIYRKKEIGSRSMNRVKLSINKKKNIHRFELGILIILFFYLGFASRTFTNHRTAGEGEGHLSPYYSLSDYCRELTSARGQQPDSNWEPLVSERKSLTTKLCAINNLLISLE